MLGRPLTIAAIACAVAASAAEAQTALKIGYVNSQQILASSA
jgi:Skp family chaperone for outer membrane proteins